MLLGYWVFAIALFGLAAIIAEALVKNPDALIDAARDAEGFARGAVGSAPVATRPGIPANDFGGRAAA